MKSASYGNYDIIVRLVEDDPQQPPVPDKDIDVWINGEKNTIETDDNGIVKISIPLNTFDDISIEAEYEESTYFNPSSEETIKKFDEEWDFFNGYSLDMVVSLFGNYSNLDASKISSVANSFFNIKEDLIDGNLDDISNIALFLELIDSEYFVDPWSNLFELRNYEFFNCPWTDGSFFATLIYSAFGEFHSKDVLFVPQPSDGEQAFVGDVFSASHTFENVIVSSKEIWDWVEHSVSSGTIFDVWNVDNVVELIVKLVTPGWHHKYKNGVHYYVKISLTKILDKYKETWDYIRTEYHRGNFPVSKTFVLEIPDDDNLQILWDTSKYGLFWHIVGDLLQLGFDYLIEQFEMQIDSIIYLLSLIGIDVYEILENIFGWVNKQKVEELKSELLEDFDEKLDHVLDKIEEIEFLNYGNDFDALPLGDNLILEATSVMSISPLLISLDDDFTESDLFDEIASKFSILTGLFVDGDELKDLFDNLCEIIDQDITLQIPGNNIPLDTTEIEEIVAGWDDLNKITSSDISNINNIIFNLEGIEGFSTNDIRDVIDLITQTIGGLESIFAPLFEELLYFLAENDPWFAARTNYDIYILIALIIDIFSIILDVLDALGWFPDIGIFDEIISLVIGIAIGYCGYNAKIKTDDTYKEKNAEYIESIGAYIFVQAYFELDTQIFYGDYTADKVGAVVEIVLDIISVCSTYWHFYEQGEVDWDAVLWAIIDGVINFPDAVLPLIKDNKKALGICVIASAIGITLLIIRLTNPGRWI